MIRILERSGEGRHDFAAVAKVATNLSPLFELAHLFKTASSFDSFLELVQIERPLVDAWEASEIVAVLLVKFAELVEVIQICTSTCGKSVLKARARW